MNAHNRLMLRLELVWWLVTLVTLAAVLFPVYSSGVVYPFWLNNTVFILVVVTFFRFIFLLKFTLIAYLQWAKVVFLFLCIPLAIYLVNSLHAFQLYVDEEGLMGIFATLPAERQQQLAGYVRAEMIFFGVGAILSAVILPFRMLISFWRTHNHGTV
ncbi:MAG: hypothetical protein RI973_473 [Bacteroidota bacterium]|jgi:hypothetical protein